MSGDYKLKVTADVLATGSKVYDENGREVGEIVGSEPAEDGKLRLTSIITDPFVGQKIVNGSQGSFSISSKVTLDD